MDQAMYWLECDGDRLGLELRVNGLPAERLMRTHGGRLPINEYLLPGANRVELRRGLWGSNKEVVEGGEASIKLVRLRVQGSLKLDETIVFDRSASFELCPPRAVLVAAAFTADPAPAPSPLAAFDPVGRAEQGLILDRLEQVAAFWRSGNARGLIEWMSPYLDDYVRAYPLESRAGMERRVEQMAAAFVKEKVEFDRKTVLLDPVPGSNLVDCLGPRGAAVRVAREKGPDYDMWSVVGVRGGEVVLVR